MEDLLQTQIHQSLKLALPEGLKELMSDIAREVLRAQPVDLYKFITEYLSALLLTRENLSIANRVCAAICECSCQPELEDELENIGLYDDDIAVVKEIILEHISGGKVNEGHIMRKLLKRTDIDQSLPAVLEATRKAFIRHQAHNTIIYQSSSESDEDEVNCAVRHTLKLYQKTRPSEEQYGMMAKKIQASYRAYGVRRYCDKKSKEVHPSKVIEKSVQLDVSNSDTIKSDKENRTSSIRTTVHLTKPKIKSVSSTSLAGSYLNLPKYRPYSAYDLASDIEETIEIEHSHIDYTIDKPHTSIVSSDMTTNRERKISFRHDVVNVASEDECHSVEEELTREEKTADSIEEVLEMIQHSEDGAAATDQESIDNDRQEH